MDATTPPYDATEPLDGLARGRVALIARIDWAALSEKEGRRMRELGFDEGVAVEKLHAAPLGQDPIAVRVGRMTIAIRRAQATHVLVERPDVTAAGVLDGLAIAAE